MDPLNKFYLDEAI